MLGLEAEWQILCEILGLDVVEYGQISPCFFIGWSSLSSFSLPEPMTSGNEGISKAVSDRVCMTLRRPMSRDEL